MKINKKILPALILPVLMGLFWIIYLPSKEKEYDNIIQELISRPISGHIESVSNAQKGYCYVNIDDQLTHSKLSYCLPKSWFFREMNISKGDSVNKKNNNKIITFYKKRGNQYIFCCYYEVNN